MVKHPLLQRAFWLRVSLISAVSLVLFFVIAALFENASGADFEPLRAGKLYAAYHGFLTVLVGVIFFPAVIISPILTRFGVDPNWGDSFYLCVVCIFDGFFLELLLQIVQSFRSPRQFSHNGQSTI